MNSGSDSSNGDSSKGQDSSSKDSSSSGSPSLKGNLLAELDRSRLESAAEDPDRHYDVLSVHKLRPRPGADPFFDSKLRGQSRCYPCPYRFCVLRFVVR